MKVIHILLFANLREKAGASTIHFDVPNHATVADILELIKQEYPQLTPHLTEKIVISINQKIALRTTLVPDGAEVALMPPVGGGGG